MTSPEERIVINQNTQKSTQESIQRSQDIANDVRNIVLEALKEGNMEPEDIRQVIHSVTDGALHAIKSTEQDFTEVMDKTVSGMDDALSRVAQASKLAIEEAAGNVGDYSDHDLKRAMDDLKDLEKLFFQTMSEIAKSSKETGSGMLNDLISHAQTSGTLVGQAVTETGTELQKFLLAQGKNMHAADAARSAGASIASIASGILAGISETLKPDDNK